MINHSLITRLWLTGVIVAAVTLAALWRFTPLRAYTQPELLIDALRSLGKHWWIPLAVVPVYIIGDALMFPNAFMNATIILALGAFPGWVYAIGGSLATATVYYLVGRRFGENKVNAIHNRQLIRLRHFLRRGGIGTIAGIRLIPTGSYAVVNTFAGAIGVKYRDFIMGTFLALLPSTLTVALVGRRLGELVRDPSAQNVAGVAAILAGGILVFLLLRRYARKHLKKDVENHAPSDQNRAAP
ncbi:MAG: hypothetical protein GF344_15085 [Chitinivibrionales bacterium]|nr:hypothetical protein [Chitinivibrionales bacterium]MBD3358031.1 hypothetical protein [Chitinivibrionales bacterium]